MYTLIKQLFALLTPGQRRRYFILQILVTFMAFSELFSVLSIGPFMAVATNPSLLHGGGIFEKIYHLSGVSSSGNFLLWLGIVSFLVMAVGEISSIFTSWRLNIFASEIGSELADRLYCYYMQQKWLFHAPGNSASLINRISSEALRVSDSIINPLLQMNARIILALLMIIAIFAFNPTVAISGTILFSTSYFVMYRLTNTFLNKLGEIISKVMIVRFKLMSEGFGGIKDVLLLNRKKDFIDRFQASGKEFAYARGTSGALAQVARYSMELIAFGSVILLVLFLSRTNGNINTILPLLATYALASLKLLPSFQAIYSCAAQIASGQASFIAIKDDLIASAEQSVAQVAATSEQVDSLQIKSSITLSNIIFTYPGKHTPTLNKLTIDIPINSTVALVGATGSGKSTAIDVLLALIEPDEGHILIDNQPLTAIQLRSWQNKIGFVSQHIFLSDASIAENVAFGLPTTLIDMDKVKSAIKLAHLDELVRQLPEGLETRVGERGIQFSGGQRQRIGIARALYDNAEILILDEATSSLDGITERMIMDAIQDFSGKKTIIMIAHRLATVRKSDIIYLLEEGRVIARGTYDELNEKNLIFHKMATHA